MNRTAIAAPAEEPETDDCNWLPLRALRRTHNLDEMCLKPCVQEFVIRVAGIETFLHRCEEHRVSDEKLGLVQ